MKLNRLILAVSAVLLLGSFKYEGPNKFNNNDDCDKKTLVVAIATNSIEGFSKFRILEQREDTVIAVEMGNNFLPGFYLVTASNKNMLYHSKLWLVSNEQAEKYDNEKRDNDFLAVITGILPREGFTKLCLDEQDSSFVNGRDPEQKLKAGTYLIVGSSNNSYYHKKMLLH